MSKTVQEMIEELKPHFDQILDYKGDENLISSCNAEYRFDESDIFLTDGTVNVRINSFYNDHNGILIPGIEITTCIRGACYIILYDVNIPDRFDLRVDRSRLDEKKKDEILNKLNDFKENLSSAIYAAKEYLPQGLGNQVTNLIDLL